jgi:hypothetical protein
MMGGIECMQNAEIWRWRRAPGGAALSLFAVKNNFQTTLGKAGLEPPQRGKIPKGDITLGCAVRTVPPPFSSCTGEPRVFFGLDYFDFAFYVSHFACFSTRKQPMR